MRHHQTALAVLGEGVDVIEWRHLLLDWMPLAWLLYFLKLLTLTATYVATRSRLERQLAEHPDPIDEQSFREAKAPAHCRRFSTVPMGDDEESSAADSAATETVQSGYRTWFFGVFLYALWMLVPIFSQLQLASGLRWNHNQLALAKAPFLSLDGWKTASFLASSCTLRVLFGQLRIDMPHQAGEMMYNITAGGLVVATLATSMLYLRRGADESHTF
eukprot:s1461_g15.t1